MDSYSYIKSFIDNKTDKLDLTIIVLVSLVLIISVYKIAMEVIL